MKSVSTGNPFGVFPDLINSGIDCGQWFFMNVSSDCASLLSAKLATRAMSGNSGNNVISSEYKDFVICEFCLFYFGLARLWLRGISSRFLAYGG